MQLGTAIWNIYIHIIYTYLFLFIYIYTIAQPFLVEFEVASAPHDHARRPAWPSIFDASAGACGVLIADRGIYTKPGSIARSKNHALSLGFNDKFACSCAPETLLYHIVHIYFRYLYIRLRIYLFIYRVWLRMYIVIYMYMHTMRTFGSMCFELCRL